MTVRVLVADDHGAVRAGIRAMLAGASDIVVVGEAADGAVAVRQARALRPDVVLMDLRMPGTDGVAATRAIVDESLAEVAVLTAVDVDEHVVAALRAGAAAFLLKTVEAAALADAIRRVAAGESVLSPEVTRSVVRRLVEVVEPAQRPDPRDRGPSGARARQDAATRGHAEALPELSQLTGRERDVLDGLRRGLSNAGIAADLGIGEATVKTHVSRVLTKLGCRSRLQAALVAATAADVDPLT